MSVACLFLAHPKKKWDILRKNPFFFGGGVCRNKIIILLYMNARFQIFSNNVPIINVAVVSFISRCFKKKMQMSAFLFSTYNSVSHQKKPFKQYTWKAMIRHNQLDKKCLTRQDWFKCNKLSWKTDWVVHVACEKIVIGCLWGENLFIINDWMRNKTT